MRSRLRRRIGHGVIGTALLVLFIGMAVAQARVPGPALGGAENAAAFCPANCLLGVPGGAALIVASTFRASTPAYTFPAVYGSDEPSSARGADPPARPGAGVVDIEYSPGEEPSALSPSAPGREATPEFGKQP